MFLKGTGGLFRTRFIHIVRLWSSVAKQEPVPLRSTKAKSVQGKVKPFVDVVKINAVGGRGGDGCISFLSLWSNEFAGPDGGDGGSGGHVVLQSCESTQGLHHVDLLVRGVDGEKGSNKHCHGKNAPHTIIKVPVGTIIKTLDKKVVGDLAQSGSLFILARGGAGGHGNHFFISSTNQRPDVAEVGAQGENLSYVIELRSMANFGLLGFPNAGKSTLLQAISRARPKVAPYPFTTIKPHLGIVKYSDYEQIAVADLPGIIEGSHKNRGLGISFLRHAERCNALVMIVDVSLYQPWKYIDKLRYELKNFSPEMASRPCIILANKMDIEGAEENFEEFKNYLKDDEIIPISAKCGYNLEHLLRRLRNIYDDSQNKPD